MGAPGRERSRAKVFVSVGHEGSIQRCKNWMGTFSA